MAKSQQTFSKSEKEKKRLKKREDKRKKMEARKLDREEHGSEGITFAYVDHQGNLTDTPPDPSMKIKVKAENIELGIPKKEDSDEELSQVESEVDGEPPIWDDWFHLLHQLQHRN